MATRFRRSTINDVAKLANVSIKTVSRVARHEPNVKDDTRRRVREAMDELNYRPSIAARSTVSARSSLLGLIFDNPNPTYSLDLMRGAQQTARAMGYHLVSEHIDASGEDVGRLVMDLVIQSNLEGLIVPPPLCDMIEVMEPLNLLGRPFALIAPTSEPSDVGFSVSMNDAAAAHAITSHLIELGHRRIALVAGLDDTAATAQRLKGYRQAMAAAGLAVGPNDVIQGDFRMRSGIEAGVKLLSQAERPTAIFAINDEMAAGVMIAAFQAGLSVPGDLSVAGFDDSPTASAMWPQITTIRQPVSEMAAAAASELIRFQRDNAAAKPDSIELEFELVIRGSTGPAPAVAQA